MPEATVVPLTSWLGYAPIAVVRAEPDDLERRLGIRFVKSHDDLDHVLQATIEGESGRVFGLVRHVHSPTAGTELLWDVRGSDVADALLDAMRALGLDYSALLWIAPTKLGADGEDPLDGQETTTG